MMTEISFSQNGFFFSPRDIREPSSVSGSWLYTRRLHESYARSIANSVVRSWSYRRAHVFVRGTPRFPRRRSTICCGRRLFERSVPSSSTKTIARARRIRYTTRDRGAYAAVLILLRGRKRTGSYDFGGLLFSPARRRRPAAVLSRRFRRRRGTLRSRLENFTPSAAASSDPTSRRQRFAFVCFSRVWFVYDQIDRAVVFLCSTVRRERGRGKPRRSRSRRIVVTRCTPAPPATRRRRRREKPSGASVAKSFAGSIRTRGVRCVASVCFDETHRSENFLANVFLNRRLVPDGKRHGGNNNNITSPSLNTRRGARSRTVLLFSHASECVCVCVGVCVRSADESVDDLSNRYVYSKTLSRGAQTSGRIRVARFLHVNIYFPQRRYATGSDPNVHAHARL